MSVSSSSASLIANGGGEGERGAAQEDGAGKTFPPRFVSDAAKNTFKYVKKVQLEADEIGDENRWTPFAFQLIPPEDNHRNVEKSELFKKIRMAGGTIHPGADVEAYVPGVIRILNEDYYVEHENEDIRVPLDTYSSAFVYRCILNKNRGLPLPHPWKYLIPSDASNFGFYDARKILREEMEWEDVGKLVFPPKDKRITAQQWLAELRRQLAKLEMTTAPPPSEDSFPSQNLNLSNGTATTPTATATTTVFGPGGSNLPSTSCPKSNDSVGSSHNQRNIQRKRSREPEKDDNTKETENDRQKTILLKKKDADQPISRSASALIATTTISNGIQVPPAATPSTSKALSPSPVKIHVKAVKLASSTSPPKNPFEPSASTPPRRIEFVRATPPKSNQSSSTTTSPLAATTSRIGPPSPKKSKTDSTAAKGGQDGNSLSNKEKSSENETSSLPSSSKAHSSSAKVNGSVPAAASASSSSTSSSTSENGRESSSPPKARLGKVVAVAGPKSRRYGPKPVPPPARDDGWVNCDDKNEYSDDESVHFSDNDGNGSDSEVDVKPKLKPFWARMYSVEEGQRLLDLICHHNAYTYVHGLKFWKLVERSGKFKDRTHQSLKNHFHKVVCQKLTSNRSRDLSTYKIDPENMKKLKRGLQNRINKHHNMCPDFEI